MTNQVVIVLLSIFVFNGVIFQYSIGFKTSICAVSGAQYLTAIGWVELKNQIDGDVPFRLFRDESRTFLQVSVSKVKTIKYAFISLAILFNVVAG